MVKILGVYTITNSINNKIYVGKSNNCYNRFSKHKSALNKNTHPNNHLQSAWNKYGEDNFKFEILEEYPNIGNLLSSIEHYWCNMLNCHNRQFGYNIRPTSHNENNKLSQETKNKISKANTGKKVSKETKEKLKIINRNKKLNETTIEKLKNNKRNQKISLYDNFGNFIKTFKSIREASRELNIDSNNIKKCILGQYNLIKNKIFKYYGDILNEGEINKRNINSLERKKIAVTGYYKNGILIGHYKSCYEAGKENNLDPYKISLCIKNKQKTLKGTTWIKT